MRYERELGDGHILAVETDDPPAAYDLVSEFRAIVPRRPRYYLDGDLIDQDHGEYLLRRAAGDEGHVR